MEFGIACESRNLNSDEIILISRKKLNFFAEQNIPNTNMDWLAS